MERSASPLLQIVVENLDGDSSGLAGRHHRLLDDPADVPVSGTSLALVLQTIMDGDELTVLETGRLADLDTARQLRESFDTHPSPPAPGQPTIEPGPNARLDEIRAAKEAAIDQQHFELAARLRDREKALLRQHDNRSARSA